MRLHLADQQGIEMDYDRTGAAAITLNLADWRIRLSCAPEELAQRVATRYAAFSVTDGADPDMTVVIEAGSSISAASASRSNLINAQLTGAETKYSLDEPGIRGKIDLANRWASLHFAAPVLPDNVEYFLRIVCALFAFDQDGLLIHAAALEVRGAVHLFIGQSGSGKSTVVALSPAAVALSDDLILLRPGPDGWMAYGTPFWNQSAAGRGGQTGKGALVGIYKLLKDRQVFLEPLPVAVAVAELAANCPVINGLAPELPDLLARCRELVQAVPVSTLHFRKDPSFWAVVAPGQASPGKVVSEFVSEV